MQSKLQISMEWKSNGVVKKLKDQQKIDEMYQDRNM